MKMQCTEGTDHGNDVSCWLDIPDQEAVDNGEVPEFVFDTRDLLVKLGAGEIDVKTAGLYTVKALELISEDIHDPEQADVVAEWLEHFAKEIRRRFIRSDE